MTIEEALNSFDEGMVALVKLKSGKIISLSIDSPITPEVIKDIAIRLGYIVEES